METETPYDEVVKARQAVERVLQDERETHERWVRGMTERLRALNQQIDAEDAGLCSVRDVEIGQKVLVAEWADNRGTPRARHPEVAQQVEAAVRDLQEGCPRMARRYFGIKAYAGWPSQIEDHQYGFGPKHGSIWFRIGLRDPLHGPELDAETRQACIRYLRAVHADPDRMLG